MDLHEPNDTPPPLTDLADAIALEVDAFALVIGDLFDKAKRRNKAKYERWVEMATPFTLQEADRLRTIAISYRDLPEESRADLPRPSSALSYTFENVDTEPWLSPTQEFSREDLLTGALMGGHPENLAEDLRRRLLAWMGDRSHNDAPPPTSSESP
jgi:hypothetical protein